MYPNLALSAKVGTYLIPIQIHPSLKRHHIHKSYHIKTNQSAHKPHVPLKTQKYHTLLSLLLSY